MRLGQSVYEVAELDAAIDRLAKLIPKQDAWPTEFAAGLLDSALVVSGTVTDSAAELLQHAAGAAAAEAIGAIAADVTKATRPIVASAQLIGEALAGGRATVLLPGFRSAILNLLRQSVIAWKGLSYVEYAKPLFLAFSASRARRMSNAMLMMEQLGQKFLAVTVPPFPTPPAPSSKPLSPRSRALLWVGFTICVAGAVGATGMLLWRHRQLHPRRAYG